MVEFGGKASAPINVVTKSGGNTFRGGAVEFFRTDALDERANFDVPNRIFGTPNFGRIFSELPARQMQLGLKFQF